MKQQIFKTKNGDDHKIDTRGNHFINGKCANPTEKSGGNIGDTYPPHSERLFKVKKL